MLHELQMNSLDELSTSVIPASLLSRTPFHLPLPVSETAATAELQALAAQNRPAHSMTGMGYHDVLLPAVLRRNILEAPGWYTAYTPYQSEISQGRLEMLLNFQQMVVDLTGLPVANASLLDEATAAAEAMMICRRADAKQPNQFFADAGCLPQMLAVLRSRTESLGVKLIVAPAEQLQKFPRCCGYLLQYPQADGAIPSLPDFVEQAHAQGGRAIVAADPLALALLPSPGEKGADICIGTSQRLAMPMGYGGPHAAFISVRDELKRLLPGRLVGVSRDSRGQVALRMALQTREQHIRRERATSNICTAQSLPAIVAAARALYEGAEGLQSIAAAIHERAQLLAAGLEVIGRAPAHQHFFDTLRLHCNTGTERDELLLAAAQRGINLCPLGEEALCLSVNEATEDRHLQMLLEVFAGSSEQPPQVQDLREQNRVAGLPSALQRKSPCLQHAIFSRYRSETGMMRYLKRLEQRDIALDRSMISLGSCTMKLNAAAEMEPISWPSFAHIHPFAPPEQAQGYAGLIEQLQDWMCELTGFDAVSLQPNSGAQGEYAGLMAIRQFFLQQGEPQRKLCLVPRSAHGTNPASAVMAGMEVAVVPCDEDGSISLPGLRRLADSNKERLAALMLTYPSTHGVFEPAVAEVCDIVHEAGGMVYLDGANFNAMIGLCRPREFGADICHLNLHKTFCIPHGGGGPGVGPVAAIAKLAPFLPGHLPGFDSQQRQGGAVAAAPMGSAGVLPISWMFIRMMGAEGLRRSAQVAILNANYLARRLHPWFPVLYRSPDGWVAHECILDLRPLRKACGVTEEDVAKRLADFGFHAPTISFPVAGTMMVEPTESESKEELDRFCAALIAIREEIAEIEEGKMPLAQSPLRRAPHSAADLAEDEWDRPYSRRQAVFPLGADPDKYWPPVNRVDNPWGDRNLICTCPDLEGWEAGLSEQREAG